MADELIAQLVNTQPPAFSALDLIVKAPWVSGTDHTIPANNVYGDAQNMFLGDFITKIAANFAPISITGAVAGALGVAGVLFSQAAYTQTDSTTAAGTVAAAYGSLAGANTLATAVNAINLTNGFNWYFKNPIAGAHVTMGTGYAVGADSLLVANNATIAGNLLIGAGSQAANNGFGFTQQAATPGTITVTAAGTAVVGTGTAFTKWFIVGDQITANGETRTIVSFASDTAMVTDAWTNGFTGAYVSVPQNGGTFWQIDQAGHLIWRGATGINNQNQSGTAIDLSGTFTNSITTNIGLIAIAPTFNYSLGRGGTISLNVSPTINYTNSSVLNANNPAIVASMNIGASNTQNWNFVAGGHVALSISTNVVSGATGTITSQYPINVVGWGNASAGATVTTAAALHIVNPFQTGTLSNYSFIAMGNGTITGAWGINDSSGLNWTMGGSITGGSFNATSSTIPPIGLYSPATNEGALSANGTRVIHWTPTAVDILGVPLTLASRAIWAPSDASSSGVTFTPTNGGVSAQSGPLKWLSLNVVVSTTVSTNAFQIGNLPLSPSNDQISGSYWIENVKGGSIYFNGTSIYLIDSTTGAFVLNSVLSGKEVHITATYV